jgi:hypothetical protein
MVCQTKKIQSALADQFVSRAYGLTGKRDRQQTVPSACLPPCRVWEDSGSLVCSRPHMLLPMSEVWTHSAEVCFSPCLRSVRRGWARWGAIPQPTPRCELLRSTRISRQEVPRLPPGEGYSGTSGQGRSFLCGRPKEVSLTPTHDRDPVVRNSCPPPARYRPRL